MFGSRSTSKATPAPTVNTSKIQEIFNSFAESDSDIITLDGLCNLCQQLELDAGDVKVLVLLWKLGASSRSGSITRDEFLSGMSKLKLDTINGLKGLVPTCDPGFIEGREFREKSIILELLNLTLDINRAPHLPLFLEFLEQSKHQRITLDQWDSFLRFNLDISLDLSNFEDDGAWPLMLDEYVAWRRTNNK